MKDKIKSSLSKLNKQFELPFEKRASVAIASLDKLHKKIFNIFAIILVLSTLGLLWKVNQAFTIEIPAKGGELIEGIVGTPRFINPLFAISDADKDLTTLIYSGLLRAGKNGILKNDLAEKYKISKNGLIYTFILKNNLVWQDGKPITADDIVFTIQKAQDAVLKSPKRASWDGVIVKKIDDKTIQFILKQPYAPFLENTTIGILPKHLWENIDPEQFAFSKYNIKPIGSGPYEIQTLKRNGNTGTPEYYDLVPFKRFAGGVAYISTIKIKFYKSMNLLLNAFKKGEIESVNSIPPKVAQSLKSKGYRVEKTPFPRVFGVFFNQNYAKIFADKEVRRALNIAVDKKKIINDILYGYASVANSPIPPGTLGYSHEKSSDEFTSDSDRISYAKDILTADGWKFNQNKKVMVKKDIGELAFSISTSKMPELKEIANMLKTQWEKIGAKVNVKIFGIGDLNENVIRPRKYDSLLFGEIVGRSSDLFAFWHSSQRLDPGLNIALYANIKADKLLEQARNMTNSKDRDAKYEQFKTEIKKDIPAIFLYYPDFIYVLPKNIKGVELGSATVPSERFLHVSKWYIDTDSVWQIFTKKMNLK